MPNMNIIGSIIGSDTRNSALKKYIATLQFFEDGKQHDIDETSDLCFDIVRELFTQQFLLGSDLSNVAQQKLEDPGSNSANRVPDDK